jgi:hypothetical protein
VSAVRERIEAADMSSVNTKTKVAVIYLKRSEEEPQINKIKN